MAIELSTNSKDINDAIGAFPVCENHKKAMKPKDLLITKRAGDVTIKCSRILRWPEGLYVSTTTMNKP